MEHVSCTILYMLNIYERKNQWQESAYHCLPLCQGTYLGGLAPAPPHPFGDEKCTNFQCEKNVC